MSLNTPKWVPPTRVLCVLLVWCVAVSVGSAQSFNVAVPNALANTEGNTSITEPLNSPTFRMQQVFDASQFAFLGGGTCRIDSIWFRLDGNATQGGLHSFSGASVQLSTTTAQVDSLSPVFGNNIGADAVTIYGGGIGFGNSLHDPTSQPQPFVQTIIATSPFLYSPSQGNLLIDIAAAGGRTFLPGGLDSHLASGDSISRVYSTDGNALAGTTDTLGLVTSFSITIVPEPTGMLLTAVATIAFAVQRFNRRRR